MKCERVEELLIDYLQGEIEPEEKRLVQAHLQQCHSCSVKLEEFMEIRTAFQSETLPEPSQEVLQSLSAKARQDLKQNKVSFWKRWFYSPILIPTLSTGLALMLWINYGRDNVSEFGDRPEYYSKEVMAERVPQGGKAIVKGQGNFRKTLDSTGRKQNAAPPPADIAGVERRTDFAAEPPSIRDGLPRTQVGSYDDEHYKEIEAQGRVMLHSELADRSYNIESSTEMDDKNIRGQKPVSETQSRQEILDELKKNKIVDYENRSIARDGMDDGYSTQPKPQAPADPVGKDDDGFRLNFGTSKVMAKKVPRPPTVMNEKDMVVTGADAGRELTEEQGMDHASRAKISEQVRSSEKESQIPKDKLEDPRLRAIDSPKEIMEKRYLEELNVALSQQKAGDCESAIRTNEFNLKNSPDAPASIKEQTYLSLAQCYEQQNKFAKAIENYNYLQQVAPSQKAFAAQKIEELNFKVQNPGTPASISEPSTTLETEVEVTK